MPVRHLDFYISQKKLISSQSLSLLKDIRLGIDGNFWLKKIISGAASELYLPGIGGTPSGIKAAIEKELEGFRAASIHPLFVFSGLSLIRKDKPHVSEDIKLAKRNAAWDAVNAGKMDLALSSWTSSSAIHQPDLIHLVIKILKENNVDYMRAPYGAGAQLSYLERSPKQIIHAIHGGSDILMFDVDRVITSIDFPKQTFSMISKKDVLQDLLLSDDQFLDVCILAGFDQFITFPPMAADAAFTFKGIHDLLRQHRTGFNAVKAHADNPQIVKLHYVESFCRARCAMRYQPILNDEGHIEPMNMDQAPSDIHDFVGYRLPDEVYYFLSRGVITEATLNSIFCGYGAEFSPLCNGETAEYRNFLTTDIMQIKAQTVALTKAQLHTFYERKVSILYWFENATEHAIKTETAPVAVKDISNWKTGKLSVEKELKKSGLERPDYSFCLGLVANDATSTVQGSGQEKPTPLSTLTEVQTRHLSKLLQLRSFIEPSHAPSAYGKAMAEALKGQQQQQPTVDLQDALFIALELIRAELLTNRPYSIQYTKKQVLEDEAATKAIRLISRVTSLIGARFKGVKSWAGPLSRELLAFNSVGKVLTRHLRHMSEAMILDMLLSNECQKESLNFTDLATQLPFAYEPSTVLGVLVKEYLETLTLANSGQGAIPASSKDQALKQVEEHIGATSLQSLAGTVKEELERGFVFWDIVCEAAKSLRTSNTISKELAQEFQDANNWVKTRKI